MGIDGMWPLATKSSRFDRRKVVTLEDFKGQTLALDANGFLYQFLYGDDKDFNYLDQFVWLYLDLCEVGAKAIFVFDGKPPPEKEEAVRKERKEKKQKLLDSIMDLEFQIEQLRSAVPSIEEGEEQKIASPGNPLLALSGEDYARVKTLENELTKKRNQYLDASPEKIVVVTTVLQKLGAIVIVSPEGEAEGTCSILNRLGHADVVVSKDSDCFVFGAKQQLRDIPMKQKRDMLKNTSSPLKSSPMVLCDLYGIREDMDLLDPDMMIDFAVLSGCDYTLRQLRGLGIKTAYEYVIKHKSIERILPVWKKVVDKRLANYPKSCKSKLKKENPQMSNEELERLTQEKTVDHTEKMRIPEPAEFDFVAARRIFREYLDVKAISPETQIAITVPVVKTEDVSSESNVLAIKSYLHSVFETNEYVRGTLDVHVDVWVRTLTQNTQK